ncbi:MAG: SDR family NAD(P)-dependent oxidoreductase [Candidatus Aenigmarchaeota archaeon]|nr:SDR family NAD(P)-dependent oxidoreductase [Candidatus Aenigmarchaeota archaeon]
MKVLVTGGAGFIGSHTVDLLVENGYEVVILDNLEPQVHGKKKPDCINPRAKFILGDVTNATVWEKALNGVNAVVHLAAMVGVGQSMYQPVRYLNVNTLGTAKFYEILLKKPEIRKGIQKIVVASSMSIYGEGAYECKNCGIVYPGLRKKEQLEKKDWEIHCPKCGGYAKPIPTAEDKPPLNLSTYALSKYDQEKLALNYGFAFNIPTVALRYFNVYGSHQTLSNPYTGCCAIFSCRIMNNNPPIIFEDGNQTRDFIYVEDVARANILCLEKFDGVDVFNIGTGKSTSILEIADVLIKLHDSKVKPKITEEFRLGDVRHAFGDVSKIKKKLGFTAKISLEEGFEKLIEWSKTQEAIDKFEEAEKERIKYLGG